MATIYTIKKSFIGISLALFSSIAIAQEQGIKFEQSDFKSLLSKAKKENKLLFVDAMASWCGPCKMMEKNIFTLSSVGDFYNKNFINTTIDMEKGEGKEIAMRYGVRSYPTFLFINGDGELVLQNMGYMDEKNFLKIGQEAANAPASFAKMKEKFLKGDRNPELLVSIIKAYANSDYSLAKQASEAYFKQKKNGILTQDEVIYLMFFIKSIEDENYQVFQTYKQDVEKFYNPEIVKNFDNQLQIKSLWEKSIDTKQKKIDDEKFLSNAEKLVGKERANEILNQNKLHFYELTNQFELYEKVALDFFGNGEKKDFEELQKAAWNISEQSNNTKTLKTAAMWMEKQIMNYETPENTFILSKLYEKLGKKQEAIMFAETSIRLSKQTRKDSTGAELLLKKLNNK